LPKVAVYAIQESRLKANPDRSYIKKRQLKNS